MEINVTSPNPLEELQKENLLHNGKNSTPSSSDTEQIAQNVPQVQELKKEVKPSRNSSVSYQLENDFPTLLPQNPEDIVIVKRKRARIEMKRLETVRLKTELNEKELLSARTKRKEKRELLKQNDDVIFDRLDET